MDNFTKLMNVSDLKPGDIIRHLTSTQTMVIVFVSYDGETAYTDTGKKITNPAFEWEVQFQP